MRYYKKFDVFLLLIFAYVCVFAFTGVCSTVSFEVVQGDFDLASNWNPQQIPASGDVAVVDSQRTCHFSTTATIEQLKVGVGSDATFNISGGTLTTGTVDKSVLVGSSTGKGYLTMTAGAIKAANRIAIGDWGTGSAEFSLSGDALIEVLPSAAIPDILCAYSESQTATVSISGTASISVPRWFDFRYGNAEIQQDGGTVSAGTSGSGGLRIGWGGVGTVAIWTMTDGKILANSLVVGNGADGYGILNLYGGEVTTDSISISNSNQSHIEIMGGGLLNVKDMNEAEVQALIDNSQITGTDLLVSTVDIGGTTYTQVYSGLSLNVTTAKNCSPADISGGDCIGDFNDLEMMVSQWLEVGDVISDISGNNEVDFEDFAMLAGYWFDAGPFETPTTEFTILKEPDSSSYAPGSSVSLLAVPEEGWRLNYWGGDLTSDSYIADVIMDSNKNITAVYSQTNAAHDEIDYTNLPIVIPGQEPIISELPYTYERDMYGYNPSFYPGEPAFDSNNIPHIRFSSSINDYTDGSNALIQKLNADGSWRTWNVLEEVRRSYPAATGLFEGVASEFSRIVIDEDDWVYTIVSLEGSTGDVILYKLPEEETWRSFDIPSISYPKLEPFEGYSPAKPPIVIGQVSGGLKMLRLSKLSGYLTINKEIDLDTGIASPVFMPTHSGSSRVTATVNNKTWFCFASLEQHYDTNGDPIPGTPQYISSYDHARQTVSDPILLGFGQNRVAATPDNHNGPAMVADSTGLLHVVMGAHNSDLWYTHSTITNPTSISDWTTPVITGITLGTYPSLVIDSNDTLHLVARDEAGIPGYVYAKYLTYARAKRSGSIWTWEDMGYMVIPWHDRYSIYYQKLSIDKHGRLFLLYHYYHNQLTQAEVDAYEAKYGVSAGSDSDGWYDGIRAQEPAVLMSDDGGDTWRLALTGDFLGIRD